MGGLLAVAAQGAGANMLYQSDFTSIGEWNYSGNTTTRVTAAPDGNGRATRFVLDRRSDKVPYRTELVMDSAQVQGEARNAVLGREYWYGFRIWLQDYQPDSDTEILFQFHEVPDRHLGEKYRNPPLAIGVTGKRWIVINRGDTKRVTPDRQSYTHYKRYDAGAWQSNRWVDWVIRVRWDYGSNGILQIWRDGEMVVNQRGTNTFNDRVGPYLKVGLYKYSWQNRRTTNVNRREIYYSGLRIARGQNQFDLVNTRRSAGPRPPAAPRAVEISVD